MCRSNINCLIPNTWFESEFLCLDACANTVAMETWRSVYNDVFIELLPVEFQTNVAISLAPFTLTLKKLKTVEVNASTFRPSPTPSTLSGVFWLPFMQIRLHRYLRYCACKWTSEFVLLATWAAFSKIACLISRVSDTVEAWWSPVEYLN